MEDKVREIFHLNYISQGAITVGTTHKHNFYKEKKKTHNKNIVNHCDDNDDGDNEYNNNENIYAYAYVHTHINAYVHIHVCMYYVTVRTRASV